ncbi:MAG TPA: TetR/AcrR family transcriptional regulator [bacterium]|jgi:AcrR family transcriptional regulator|nr:TetR/AcrR family transcriptional regulator [bacterium]HNT66966.1 TetR/AcrR family transcriptional regulator [bacterium]HOX85075.1 TetR/AcrR family transcriptional regulator [bacterium]HPG44060.1 TetR/AcrR family transcriptional regulator [bacterium]HPM96426.1 TetR/AcrR family transcriptional regulator [bacterium]
METLSKRQQEIVQAAIDLIAENGIQELTIKKLSARIGVTEAALYRHFRSKMDILLAILALFRRSGEQTVQKVNTLADTSGERLEALFLQRLHQLADHPTIAAVIFSEEIFQNDRRLADTVYSIMSDNLAAIVELVAEGQRRELLRRDVSAENLAILVMGSLRLLVTRWRLTGFDFDLNKEGGELWKTLKVLLYR